MNVEDQEAIKTAVAEGLDELRRLREAGREDYAQIAAAQAESDRLRLETHAILAELAARQEKRARTNSPMRAMASRPSASNGWK